MRNVEDGTGWHRRQVTTRWLVAQGIATVLGGGCGEETTLALADLHPNSMAVTVGEFSELKVEVGFPGVGAEAKSGCPTLGSSVAATVNGQTMDVVSRGGAVTCQSTAAPVCPSCAGLSFQLERAWDAAKPDGFLEISIADSSYHIAMTASGALLPNAISLSPPATTMVSRGDLLILNVEARTPPLSTLDFYLIRPSDPAYVEIISIGTKAPGSGSVGIELPTGIPLDFYQLQAKSDTSTSPLVETCEGVASCAVGPTKLMGSLDLRVEG